MTKYNFWRPSKAGLGQIDPAEILSLERTGISNDVKKLKRLIKKGKK